MKLTISNTGWLLFVAALIYIFLLRECKHYDMVREPHHNNAIQYHDSTIVKHDTTTHVLYKPYRDTEIVFKHDTIYKTFTLAQLDTVAVHYYDTYVITRQFADSNLRATIKDTLTRNIITGQHINYTILKPTSITYNPPVQKLRNKVYIGAQVALHPFNYIALTTTATLITKQDHSYTIGYDVVNKAASVGMAWKVRL